MTPAGVPVSGEGWSAFFPGEPEPFVDEVALPELDITLSNDLTLWEAGEAGEHGELNALAFAEATTPYQVLHLSSANDGAARATADVSRRRRTAGVDRPRRSR